MEFFKKTLDPSIALAIIAAFDIFLFLIVGAWTVGGGETMMTGLIAKFFMGDAIDSIPFLATGVQTGCRLLEDLYFTRDAIRCIRRRCSQ